MPPATDLQDLVLEHIQASHAALDTAKTQLEKAAADKAAFEAGLPAVVEALVRHQRILPEAREKLAAALRDPAQLLEIMLKVADPAVTTAPARLGGPAAPAVKRAADQATGMTLASDARRMPDDTESGQKFKQAFLGR